MRQDILCQAKSGMGKTAVFVLATLHQVRYYTHRHTVTQSHADTVTQTQSNADT